MIRRITYNYSNMTVTFWTTSGVDVHPFEYAAEAALLIRLDGDLWIRRAFKDGQIVEYQRHETI